MAMELTPIQTEMLNALIALYHQKKDCVKGVEIAKLVNRNPGTVRNQMQSLKALRLVEGVPGPKGGYKPTTYAYDVLSIQNVGAEAIPVLRNGQPVEGMNVLEISLTSVHHPYECHSTVKLLGNLKLFDDGDTIEIGPTPVNRLVMRGKVIDRDDMRNLLLFEVEKIITLPKQDLSQCELSKLSMSVSTKVRDAARLMLERCELAAMVERGGDVVGVVDVRGLARAIIEQKADSPLVEVMEEPMWVDADIPIAELFKLFTGECIYVVVVEDGGECLGILDCKRLLRVFPLM